MTRAATARKMMQDHAAAEEAARLSLPITYAHDAGPTECNMPSAPEPVTLAALLALHVEVKCDLLRELARYPGAIFIPSRRQVFRYEDKQQGNARRAARLRAKRAARRHRCNIAYIAKAVGRARRA